MSTSLQSLLAAEGPNQFWLPGDINEVYWGSLAFLVVAILLWKFARKPAAEFFSGRITTISGDGRDRFPVAGAGYMYDTRDLQEYPSRGTMIGVTLTKYGVPGHDLDFFRAVRW